MFGRIKRAIDGLIDSLLGFKADVDETREKWREQFKLDTPADERTLKPKSGK